MASRSSMCGEEKPSFINLYSLNLLILLSYSLLLFLFIQEKQDANALSKKFTQPGQLIAALKDKSFSKLFKENELSAYFSVKKEIEKYEKKINRKIQNSSQIANSVVKASRVYDLPPKLILALIIQESSFRQKIISPAGAHGFMQLMPSTAKAVCGLNKKDLLNIELNILCGSKYLKSMLKRFNKNVDLSLAAYNSGPTRVSKLKTRIGSSRFTKIKKYLPRETQNYVASVNSLRQSFFDDVMTV